jgi:hypothetical protein
MNEPTWTNHGGRRHPEVAVLVTHSQDHHMQRLAIIFLDKTSMLL